jgi:hypothetical protein
MFKLSETKTFSSGTRYIRPGTYLAEITKVADSEKYFNGDAFVVNYQLYSLDNQTVGEFAETFFNNTANRRTQDLAKLMTALGIDDANDLVGVTIRVNIKYRVTESGYRLPSIDTREVLPESSATIDDVSDEVQ